MKGEAANIKDITHIKTELRWYKTLCSMNQLFWIIRDVGLNPKCGRMYPAAMRIINLFHLMF